MLSDRMSPISLPLADNYHRLHFLNRNMACAIRKKGRCLPIGSCQYCFWEIWKLVCLCWTNYPANYTLGKLILGAKDVIALITTNIVLGYKLPGSLDSLTFYSDMSNRFIICAGKKLFFFLLLLKLLFQLLEYQMNFKSFQRYLRSQGALCVSYV